MPLAMRNLAIAQPRQKERYSLIRGGEWAKPKASFAMGDYVMVKRETKNTLQAPAYPHVPRYTQDAIGGARLRSANNAASRMTGRTWCFVTGAKKRTMCIA